MAKRVKIIAVFCGACHIQQGAYPEKELPKSFICSVCGTGQQVASQGAVGFTRKRNYPLGFFS